MTTLLLIVTASLLFVLATPDSVSHDDQLQTMPGFERTSLEMPRRSGAMRHDLLTNDLRLSGPNVYPYGAFVNPIARRALEVSEAARETPVIRAARNHAFPLSPEENEQIPRQMAVNGQRGAIVTPSGQQLIEMLRRRRNSVADIEKAYQLSLAA
jgi:hypothetical protein